MSTAEQPKPFIRQITVADSVLAVYRENWGLASRGTPTLILAIWPDGYASWSRNALGGPPYQVGRVDPQKVAALLSRFQKDGLFASDKLADPHFGPDSQFITQFVKSSNKQMIMRSWHELAEGEGNHVATSRGVKLDVHGGGRFSILSKEPADYLYFRFVWNEVRGELNRLLPADGESTSGKLLMKAGQLSWQEEPVAKEEKKRRAKRGREQKGDAKKKRGRESFP